MLRMMLSGVLMGMMVVACGGDGTGPAPEERKALLEGKEWVVESRTISPGFAGGPDGVSTDYYVAGSDCYRDDIHRFVAGGKYEEDAGPRRCLWQDDNLRNGTWTVNGAGTEIVLQMEDNSDPFVWRIVAMDGKGLTVTYPSFTGWGDGVKRQETLVLKKK